MADPVIRWAIKYVNWMGDSYIDHRSISILKRDAWNYWEADWEPSYAKSMRRRGKVKAVRVEIREVPTNE